MSNDEKTFVRWWVRDRLEPLTARRVVAVEGISDRIILEQAADLTNRNLDRLGVSLLEVRGVKEMGPVDKLFGAAGFDIPMSLLVDEDAEQYMARKLDVTATDLPSRSVWVSRADLEAEYVTALGATNVWNALVGQGHFKPNQLQQCAASGTGGVRTDADIIAFCRSNKVLAALSVAAVLTKETASQITSVENVLEEVAA